MSADKRCSVNEVYTFEAKDFGRFKEATKVFFAEENKKHYQYMTFAFDGETRAEAFATFNSVEQFLGSTEMAFPFKKEVLEYSKIVVTDICGTAADIKKWQESPQGEVVKDKVRWFEVQEGGFVNDKVVDSSSVRITPYFKVKDWVKAKAGLPDFVSATKPETECTHYGFAYCEKETILHCREAYTGAAGLLAHLGHVGGLIKRFGDENIADIIGVSITGPRDEVEKLKEPTAAFNADYYITN